MRFSEFELGYNYVKPLNRWGGNQHVAIVYK